MEWTREELKLLKKFYPIMGSECKQFFPRHNTVNAVQNEARRQGIKFGLFKVGEESFLDIESTNLNADFAFMLSYSFKVKGIEDKIYSNCITREEILSGNLDKRLIENFMKDLRRFKRIYTYYGSRFDMPFARTRALANGYSFIPYGLIQHQDLYYMVRNKLKLSSNRLDRVCQVLGIEGKNHLEPRTWTLATIGNEEALKYVLEHNIKDVLVLEKVYNKLKEYGMVTKRSV